MTEKGRRLAVQRGAPGDSVQSRGWGEDQKDPRGCREVRVLTGNTEGAGKASDPAESVRWSHT